MIGISWVLDFVNNLPNFLAYVVPGYILIYVYRYIAFKDRESAGQVSYLLLNSIVVSFVLKTLYDAALSGISSPVSTNGNPGYLILLFIFGAVSGFILSKFIKSNIFQCIRKALGVNRTANDNIWDDIMTPGVWIRVWLRDSNQSYLGQIKYLENYEREPIVVLEYYQFLGADNEILVDNSEKPKRTVMLNTRDFERIEIIE